MDIYAPLANRLGIGSIKMELEDLAFNYLDPQAYKAITELLTERRETREQRIRSVILTLKEKLAEANIHNDISGRAKHIYSIYRKMQRKNAEVYDASAVRILVPTVADCYAALSIAHSLWEHIPEEFDDYIATPKPNGYRSIHTVVKTSGNKPLEIQIRTYAMHEEAELGVAAHWLYKEGVKSTSGYEDKIIWLRQLLDWHKEVATKPQQAPTQSYEQVFADRVYVFTPQGDIVDLIPGATPLDFAYHVHSGLGHRCRGAKINGNIVPLTYQLQTGDKVEILTTREGGPSRDWLNPELRYLQTPRARAKVAQWFRQQDFNKYIEEGRHTLERELHRAGIHQVNIAETARRFQFKDEQALFSAIGHGHLRAAQIVHGLQQHPTIAPPPPVTPPSGKLREINQGAVRIEGVGNLLTRIARCCKPIPGDPIIGFITQGRGVSIHRKDCSNMNRLNDNELNRILQVNWEGQVHATFHVDIQIRAYNKLNLLHDITSILANAKINLIAINTYINKNNQTVHTTLTVEVHNMAQLKQLLQQFNQLSNVIEAVRLS